MSRTELGVPRRWAFTLVELLVVIGIIGALIALLLPAIQKVRAAAQRVQCQNNLRQLGTALHLYHDNRGTLPAGVTSGKPGEANPWMSWHTRLLPYLDQQPLWDQTQIAYEQDPTPFDDPPHLGFATVLPVFICPADPRTTTPQSTHNGRRAALTDYVGIAGTQAALADGVLYLDSKIRLAEITDGLSSTLLVGERPPSSDYWYGWWYAGVGQAGSGSPDMLLGIREQNLGDLYLAFCSPGPYHFVPGRFDSQCDVLHYWSPHIGGGNFLFADGSVHFLAYSADDILPALATRKGGESVPAGEY